MKKTIEQLNKKRSLIEALLLAASFLGITATIILGIWITPPDVHLGNTVRLLYLHPPTAWVALYLCFGVTTLSSLLYLVPKTRSLVWDRIAYASCEIGILFLSLTLVTGSIWGHITWGVFWTWDARLTSTAMLLVLYLGYLAVRQIAGNKDARAKRSAIAGLIAFLDVPIVHFSVNWWNTLHQKASILQPSLDFKVHGIMLFTLLLGFIGFSLLYFWMLMVRYDIAKDNDDAQDLELDRLLNERRSEVLEVVQL
jgi:heme exporter protein C